MTETVVVIEADRPVSEVLDCFFQYPIHHLPVVRDGRLAGMLSSADLLKLEHLVPKGAGDPARFLDERLTTRQLMRTPVTTLRPSDAISTAAERMIEAGVHAAPVVDDAGKVIGIVTTTDVMHGLLRGPPRRIDAAAGADPTPPPAGDSEQVHYHRRPTDDERALALSTAETLHVEVRDRRYLGKTLLYLEERNAFLERVYELADRFLLTGQDVQVHSQLLKAILAAKRAEEHATGRARVPFPLQ
jgi:CBS domain-containing protein